MKKFKFLLLAVVGLLCGVNVFAQTFWVNGINYNILNASEKTVEVARDESYRGDITIPSIVEYGGDSYAVVKIANKAFYNTNITSVRFPETLTEIGNESFKYCTYLSGISFSNGLQQIGNNAFESSFATTFRYLDLPEGLLSLGKEAFTNCENIQQITLPNSLSNIGESAFSGCDRLTSVSLPENLTNIPDYMCSACPDLRTCPLPKNLKRIGEGAFINCDDLRSIYLPGTLTYVGSNAFNYVKEVISDIPADKLFEVEENTFYKKENKTLYVPYGAKSVYENTPGWIGFKEIIERECFSVLVTSIGYASMFVDKAVMIPNGVIAYTANKVENNFVELQEIEGIIPANTGVIIGATEGCYQFDIVDEMVEPITGNLFHGTVVDEWISLPKGVSAYVLSLVDGEVGMYLAKLTDGCFLNNANKAYLLLDNNKLGISDEELDTSEGGAQLSLRFNFGGATGVDKVQTEVDVNHTTYDLYGRKVSKITTPGLYIVNGKKVWVK